MLTGNVPFQNMETDFDIRESIVRKDFIKPTHFNPKVPGQLEAIIMKSIAKKPENRYQTAEEMLEDVQRFEAALKGTAALKKTPAKRKALTKKRVKSSASFLKSKSFLYSVAALIALNVLFFSINIIFNTSEPQINQELTEEKSIPVPGDTSVAAKADTIKIVEKETQPPPALATVETKPNLTKKTTDAVPATGTLYISSDPPQSKIYINGRYKGQTPYTVFGVRSGNTLLLLKADGYEDYSETISIGKGQRHSLNKKLVPLTGAAIVRYKPSNVIIKLDGNLLKIQSNPLNLSDLNVGSHVLEISKTGYSTFSSNIEIKKNETTSLNVTLKELIGKLSVLVKPWGSIYINNKMEKANTDIKFEKELPVDKYLLKIIHPTFGEWKKQIAVKAETEESIIVDFTTTITVQVNALDTNNKPVTAKIIVDNKPTDFTTPENIKVRPGIHSFLVEKEGFIATEDRKEFLVDNSFKEQITFVLKKIE